MKLDRKEILKALETIIAGKNMVESGAVTNVVTLAMRLLLIWFCIRRRCTSRKSRRRHKKNNPRLSFARSKVKVNTKVEAAVAESPNQIKGKSIPE
jgi:ATP-binding protein involved in chromosome partitioning